MKNPQNIFSKKSSKTFSLIIIELARHYWLETKPSQDQHGWGRCCLLVMCSATAPSQAPFSFQIFFYIIYHIEFLDTYIKH